MRQPATSLVFVAQATGCFAAERLDVQERSFELGRDALASLLDGKADVAIAYETPTLRRYGEDQRIRALSVLHSSTRNTRVVARRASGIQSVRDLRGRRLSAASGTNADFFVEHLLTFGGMSRSDLTVVDLEPDAAVDELVRGSLDAAVLSDPHAERATRALGGQSTELVSDLYAEFSLVLTRADVVAARRGPLLAFMRGLLCAERKLHDAPAEAFAAVRARFPERSESELQVALGRVHRGVGLDEVLRWALEGEARWLQTNESRGRVRLEVPQLIDASLLEEVDPSAVNMLTHR